MRYMFNAFVARVFFPSPPHLLSSTCRFSFRYNKKLIASITVVMFRSAVASSQTTCFYLFYILFSAFFPVYSVCDTLLASSSACLHLELFYTLSLCFSSLDDEEECFVFERVFRSLVAMASDARDKWSGKKHHGGLRTGTGWLEHMNVCVWERKQFVLILTAFFFVGLVRRAQNVEGWTCEESTIETLFSLDSSSCREEMMSFSVFHVFLFIYSLSLPPVPLLFSQMQTNTRTNTWSMYS